MGSPSPPRSSFPIPVSPEVPRTPVVRPGLPRWFDVLTAGAGLGLAAPLLLASAAAVKLSSPGPVIFGQTRVGQSGLPFRLYKLRTMALGRPGPGVTAGGDSRVTNVGRWLRRTKLDELPEFWNVLRGDMAIVGPRPEVPQYVDLDSQLWRVILQARPGLTDPVTVALRNEEELLAGAPNPERYYLEVLQTYKLKHCAAYLKRRTWRTDLAVVFKTIWVILRPNAARGAVDLGLGTPG